MAAAGWFDDAVPRVVSSKLGCEIGELGSSVAERQSLCLRRKSGYLGSVLESGIVLCEPIILLHEAMPVQLQVVVEYEPFVKPLIC